MDAKNLEKLKAEMERLGFSDTLTGRMEEKMAANEPRFILYDKLESDKGRVELALHFNQSRSSEFYYFNKFDVVIEVQPPLMPGEKYFVASQRQGKEPALREFEMAWLAVKDFRASMAGAEDTRRSAQLYSGTELASSKQLASHVDGQIVELDKGFYKTLMTPAPGQTVYLEKGTGFTLSQTLNLLSGRSVYREDMLNIQKNEYSAWVKLELDSKDKGGNFPMKTFTHGYGYDLSAVLDRFEFKELANPQWRAELEATLKNGDRGVVNVDVDGKATKLLVEAVPEFKQLNLYSLEGKSIRREQHQKAEPLAEVSQEKGKAAKKGKDQELSV